MLKTPITYYGGKQSLLSEILPLTPDHTRYCEPYFGGGAYFFAKEPVQVETINDINHHVINFYRILKTDYRRLKTEIDASLYSRELHLRARQIIKHPAKRKSVLGAWAFWYLCATSMNAKYTTSSFKTYSTNEYEANTFQNRKDYFTEKLAARLERTVIESRPALEVIKRCPVSTFLYLDPVYLGTDGGPYQKLNSKADFIFLMEFLSSLEKKFLHIPENKESFG